MPPKKVSKPDKGQQKAVDKQKAKIIEDKTFGLKNKNKSKAVQKYIKEVTQQVKGSQKGGIDTQAQKQIQEKEEKKKTQQQQALLASLFKGTENIKKIAEKNTDNENDSNLNKDLTNNYDPKQFRELQKIDLFTDQRILKNIKNYESVVSGEFQIRGDKTLDDKVSENLSNAMESYVSQTDIVCKNFIEAVEKKQYGWFWVCPNGGDNCKYRHALPPDYVFKKDPNDLEEDDDLTVEERIEIERRALSSSGKLVTLEYLTNKKKQKEAERLKDMESRGQKVNDENQKLNELKLSGRDLFTLNPSVFIDDDDAADEVDYEEDEKYWDEVINQNQKNIDEANIQAVTAVDKETVTDLNEKREVVE